MNQITLKPLKVEDYLGRKHVRGVLASQEIFEVDMLNRTLVELCGQRSAPKVAGFLDDLWEDAKQAPSGGTLKFDEPTESTFQVCVKAGNPLVALSLLRLARIEQLHLGIIWSKLGHDMRVLADKEVQDYLSPGLQVGLHTNGEPEPGFQKRIYRLTGKQILEYQPNYDWYFSEFLNTPYAVDAGLLDAARLIIAKCYSLKTLERLYSDKMTGDGYAAFSLEMNYTLEEWRVAYVKRQIHWTFIELTGFANGQTGMPQLEAQAILRRERKDNIRAA